MILIEFFGNILKFTWYCIARFFVWIITARDCKHCKYGKCEYFTYDVKWMCTREDMRHQRKCDNSITKVYFERKCKGDDK